LSSSPLTTLIVIRHGETVWNQEMRFQGHGDSPLTARGRAQAHALGQRLQAMPIDSLICSDLGRARETAAIIRGYTGHTIQLEPRLRERHYGVLEGLNAKEILEQHPGVYQALITENPDYEIPGGETHRQHYQKTTGVLEAWADENPGTTTALVVHGGVLENFFRYIAHLDLRQPRCVLPANASLSVIQYGTFYGSIRWVIKTWGDAAHLENIEETQG
jgi:2,3-bisphosphoglycerate-dependent phosphoglycerate mutase